MPNLPGRPPRVWFAHLPRTRPSPPPFGPALASMKTSSNPQGDRIAIRIECPIADGSRAFDKGEMYEDPPVTVGATAIFDRGVCDNRIAVTAARVETQFYAWTGSGGAIPARTDCLKREIGGRDAVAID